MLELQLLPLKCYRAVNAWPVGLQGDSATDSRYAGPTVEVAHPAPAYLDQQASRGPFSS
jgi:hypothetical protein